MNAHPATEGIGRQSVEIVEFETDQRDLLEQILTAEVLAFARLIKLGTTTIMDEAISTHDFRDEAIKEIKRNRSEVIAKLMAG